MSNKSLKGHQHMRLFFAASFAAAILSGCGTTLSEGNEDVPGNTGSDTVTFSDLTTINDELRRASARLFAIQGATPELPASGTANFVGSASFSEDALPQILAGAVLQADFNADTISGTLAGFTDEIATRLDGTLSVSNGRISGPDSSITADIAGRLTSDMPAMATVDVAGTFEGKFIGDNHSFLRGDMAVSWTTNAGTAGEELRTMQGEITAAKQP